MARGLTMNMGITVVLSTGKVDIVVISRHVEPYDPGCFTSVGIDPTQRRYLMLKSRIHYRVGFRNIGKAFVECAGVGVVRRIIRNSISNACASHIYPLDRINTKERFERPSSASRSTLPPLTIAPMRAAFADVGASSNAASGTAPDGSTTSFMRSKNSRVARMMAASLASTTVTPAPERMSKLIRPSGVRSPSAIVCGRRRHRLI